MSIKTIKEKSKEGRFSKFSKIVAGIVVSILGFILLSTLIFSTINETQRRKEITELQEAGYYNRVIVNDYGLNVIDKGNKEGNHTIVCISSMDVNDYSVTIQSITKQLEDDNRVVIIDRSGYGASDDSAHEQTVQHVVDDYRGALKAAGINAPYVLLPHEIGGMYATYWASTYPDELEGIVFLDGIPITDKTAEQSSHVGVTTADEQNVLWANLGLHRMAKKYYTIKLPLNYSDEEQKFADYLNIQGMWGRAKYSELGLFAHNMKTTYESLKETSIPKLYISSTAGYTTGEEIDNNLQWVLDNYEINGSVRDFTEEEKQEILKNSDQYTIDFIMPYLKSIGNCELINIGGDRMIYKQRPDDCVKAINYFFEKL